MQTDGAVRPKRKLEPKTSMDYAPADIRIMANSPNRLAL